MALTQTGENQRKIGLNLSKIIGLKDTPEKMKPLNMERQKGGYNAVGYNANGQPCGCGNGDPNGGSGNGNGGGSGGSGGGGSGGGGVVMPCVECVTLAEAAAMYATGEKPCCISGGKDCDTGEDLPICLAENCGGGYGKGCNPPPPPNESCETVVITYNKLTGETPFTQWETVYLLSTIDSAAGDLSNALQMSLDSIYSTCGSGNVDDENTVVQELYCKGIITQITYKNNQRTRTQNCGYHIASCNLISQPNIAQYNLGLENWKKPSGKYLKNGKFYDACGIEQSDCITVCDENGNQYKICADNVGNPKVEPV